MVYAMPTLILSWCFINSNDKCTHQLSEQITSLIVDKLIICQDE